MKYALSKMYQPVSTSTSNSSVNSGRHRTFQTRSGLSVSMSGNGCECRKMAEFREEFRKCDDGADDESCCKSMCICNQKRAKNCINSVVPSYRIMRKYKWKTDLVSDIICGATVGIMQLPQGMAYAMLAEMPPVVGLYMSFFPVLIYFIFGSSRHISMGTVAVVSLLTGSVIAKFYDSASVIAPPIDNSTLVLNETLDPYQNTDSAPLLPVERKIAIAMTLSMLVGFTQVIMGSLRLGFVTTYMSDPLISGFTTASAIHVGTSQIKYIFGLKIPRTDGLFQVIKTYKFIFERISHTNFVTFGVSIVCIIIIYLVKVQINQRFKAKLRIPVPIELLVVIAGTLCSHFLNFHDIYHVKVVGDVPAGLPTPSVPSFEGVNQYIADIPIIAVVSFAQSVSLAAIMAKKHKYTIDANQELIAYGAGNIFGSFFSCYPIAASVSRSSVQDSAGGKSQVASLVSASLVLVVILWLGPLFEALPNCVLSAIIVVALRSLLLQVLELPKVWRTSRFDFFIWIVTCICATILHVDYGLLIGLFFSFFTVVLRTQRAKPTRLGKISNQGVFKDPKVYVKTHQHTGIKIIGFSSPLYFANGDIFVKEVYRLSTVKPERLRKQIRRASQLSQSSRRTSLVSTNSGSTTPNGPARQNSTVSLASVASTENGSLPFVFENPISHVVIDFSAITFVDTVGCKVLKQMIEDYDNVDIPVFMANVSDDVWCVFEATELLPKYKDVIFVTLDDAVTTAFESSREKSAIHDADKTIVKVYPAIIEDDGT